MNDPKDMERAIGIVVAALTIISCAFGFVVGWAFF